MSNRYNNSLRIYFIYYHVWEIDAEGKPGKSEPGTAEISAPWSINRIEQIRAIENALSKDHAGRKYMIINFKFLRMERPGALPAEMKPQ